MSKEISWLLSKNNAKIKNRPINKSIQTSQNTTKRYQLIIIKLLYTDHTNPTVQNKIRQIKDKLAV